MLRPGGLVVPIEGDLSTWRSLPETALYAQMRSWTLEAFARAGMAFNGQRLWAILEEAGLRPLGMIGIQVHIGPDDEVGLAYEVESQRVGEPLLVGTGVATTEEIGLETLEQRLRDEREKARAIGAIPIGMGAWATTDLE